MHNETIFQKQNRARIVKELENINAFHADIENTRDGSTDMYKMARSYGIPKFPASESFKTHNGEVVKGERLKKALNHVADKWAENAKAIRKNDNYASHVTESTKDLRLEQGLRFAEYVRAGHIESFTISQRVNTFLTGECIALLPK